MICDICGNDTARLRRVTRQIGRGKHAFLIQNVPVVACSHCGESYLTADTLQEIERIRHHWRELVSPKTMHVARYEKKIA